MHTNQEEHGLRPSHQASDTGERDYNNAVSSIRMTIDNSMGELKYYEIMNKPYTGIPEEFNVVSGLANFKLMWEENKGQLTAWRRT